MLVQAGMWTCLSLEVSGVRGQGLQRGCPFCGGTGRRHVSAAGASKNSAWVREGCWQAAKGRSGPGPRAAEHRSVPGLLLADFSCRSERFRRAALPGVLAIV